MMRLLKYYQDDVHIGVDWKTTETKAGLQLLTGYKVHVDDDNKVNVWKLEVTVRSESVHRQICNHIRSELSGWSVSKRLQYIQDMRRDFLAKDEAAMLKRKSIWKVLPESHVYTVGYRVPNKCNPFLHITFAYLGTRTDTL